VTTTDRTLLFLVHWNAAEAAERAAGLAAAGWQVEIEAEDGARAIRSIRNMKPSVVLIYLDRLPSHGRETAKHLVKQSWSEGIPVVFAGGDPDKVVQIKQAVPRATFVEIGAESLALQSALADRGMP
jgi:AmiR/NasT family two-component response regulator